MLLRHHAGRDLLLGLFGQRSVATAARPLAAASDAIRPSRCTGEEVLDIFLLVVRNLFQFGRLALVMRKYVLSRLSLPASSRADLCYRTERLRSGKNVFTRPAPIDLSSARAYSFSLDLDLDDEEALSTERRAMGGDADAIGRTKARVGATGLGLGLGTKKGGVGPGRREEQPFLLDSDEEEE